MLAGKDAVLDDEVADAQLATRQLLDDALVAAEGSSRLYEILLKAFIGVGLFGSSSIMVLAPILADPLIAMDPLFASDALVFGNAATFAGWAAGSILAGGLSDKFGRKSVVVAAGCLGSAGVLAGALAPNAAVLVAGRFVGGLSLGGTVGQGYVLVYESLARARSATLSTELNVLWVGTVALIAGCHTLELPWRVEQGLQGGFVGLCALAVALLAVETPTYLALSGRRDDATAAVERIARLNGAGETMASMQSRLREWSQQSPPAASGTSLAAANDGVGFVDQVRRELLGSRLQQATLSMCFAYASLTFGYYAISFSAGSLSDALLFNFVCLAALDVPGYLLAAKLVAWRGALTSATAGLTVTGVLLLGTATLAQLHVSAELVTATAFAAKLAAATTFCVLYDLPVELFPEQVRGSATGLAQSSAHFGGLLSPLVIAYLPIATADVVCSSMCLAAAVVLSFMLAPAPPADGSELELRGTVVPTPNTKPKYANGGPAEQAPAEGREVSASHIGPAPAGARSREQEGMPDSSLK